MSARRDDIEHPLVTGDGLAPGDPNPRELVRRMIRVDHAGEYGAKRIYEGQLAVLGRGPHAAAIRRMYEQELRHLEVFEDLLAERSVRPTALHPLWRAAGFALGAASAAMGAKTAMAVTVAVEEVIDEHYANQARRLGDDEAELREQVLDFRDEEIEHRDAALAHGAERAPAYPLLSVLVKTSSRAAIWLSERL